MQKREAGRVTYKPPTCLAEARSVRQKLIEDIADINAQLSDKNKRRKCLICDGSGAVNDMPCRECSGRGGFRWADHEYHAWRQRALTALRARETVLRRVNAWISDEENRATAIERGVPVDTHDLVRKAHNLFLDLAEDGVEYESEEWKVIEELRIFLEPTTAHAAS